MDSNDVRRLIIKLLILGVLEEIFLNQRNNITVYVQVKSDRARATKLQQGRLPVLLSHGILKSEANELCISDDRNVKSKPKPIVMEQPKMAEQAMQLRKKNGQLLCKVEESKNVNQHFESQDRSFSRVN